MDAYSRCNSTRQDGHQFYSEFTRNQLETVCFWYPLRSHIKRHHLWVIVSLVSNHLFVTLNYTMADVEYLQSIIRLHPDFPKKVRQSSAPAAEKSSTWFHSRESTSSTYSPCSVTRSHSRRSSPTLFITSRRKLYQNHCAKRLMS